MADAKSHITFAGNGLLASLPVRALAHLFVRGRTKRLATFTQSTANEERPLRGDNVADDRNHENTTMGNDGGGSSSSEADVARTSGGQWQTVR